jgi:hypothetical protein
VSEVPEGGLDVARDSDCLVLDDEVPVVISGCRNIAPEELRVECFSINKGGKIVEVVACGVEPDDDCSVNCAECDDN